MTFTGKGEHILLVDDEDSVSKMLKQMLETLNYKITRFTSSSEALEHYKMKPCDFDLIITDQSMPDLSGISLIKNIREINSEQKVILISGYIDVAKDNDIKKLKVDSTLIKPVDMKIWSRKIRTVIDK